MTYDIETDYTIEIMLCLQLHGEPMANSDVRTSICLLDMDLGRDTDGDAWGDATVGARVRRWIVDDPSYTMWRLTTDGAARLDRWLEYGGDVYRERAQRALQLLKEHKSA